MKIKIYPVIIEAYDDADMALFKLTCTDEVCADIQITTPISRAEWPELSKAIQDSLDKMFPQVL